MSDVQIMIDYVMEHAPAGSPAWLAAARVSHELHAPAVRALLLAQQVEREMLSE